MTASPSAVAVGLYIDARRGAAKAPCAWGTVTDTHGRMTVTRGRAWSRYAFDARPPSPGTEAPGDFRCPTTTSGLPRDARAACRGLATGLRVAGVDQGNKVVGGGDQAGLAVMDEPVASYAGSRSDWAGDGGYDATHAEGMIGEGQRSAAVSGLHDHDGCREGSDDPERRGPS